MIYITKSKNIYIYYCICKYICLHLYRTLIDMKTITTILIAITLTSCAQIKHGVERLEYNHDRLDKQPAFKIEKCDTIKAWRFQDRYDYTISSFIYQDQKIQWSFRSFDEHHKGDTIYNDEYLISEISIKRIK